MNERKKATGHVQKYAADVRYSLLAFFHLCLASIRFSAPSILDICTCTLLSSSDLMPYFLDDCFLNTCDICNFTHGLIKRPSRVGAGII